MLGTIKKDMINSTDIASFYDVNDRKFIAIDTTRSGRILEIRLCSNLDGSVEAKYRTDRIIYLEDISIEEDEQDLDLDALAFYEDYFQEVC